MAVANSSTDRLLAPERAEEDSFESSLRPKLLAEFVGQAAGARKSLGLHPGGARARRSARPCAVFRAAGPRQDHAGADRGARAGRQFPLHLGAGAGQGRRSGRHPHQSRAARRALHRRDPPPQSGGRGNSLSGDGGFRTRSRDRRGAVARARSRSRSQPFTLVGATTRSGLITTPLRDRFGIPVRLNFYTADELVAIVARGARVLGFDLDRRRRARDRRPRARHAAHRRASAQARARFRGRGGACAPSMRRSPMPR